MKQQWIESNSCKLSVTILGEGKPLLMLHGWGSNSKVMLPLARQMATFRQIIIPDLAGFGDSPEPPRAFSVQDYADLIPGLLLKLEIEKCDVLAHSFGGRMMLKLLSDSNTSALFDKVLITGGAGMKPKRGLGYYRRLFTAKLLKAPFAILPGNLRAKALQWLRQTSVWKSLGSGEYRELSGVMRESFVKTVTEFLEPCLPKITHDILLLWGELDDATPLYQAKRMDAGLTHSALVTIANAGHYAFLDQPGQFFAIAKAYFEG